MIRISSLKIPVENNSKNAIVKKCARNLKIKEDDIQDISLVKKSIDARDKENCLYVYTIDVKIKNRQKEESLVKKLKKNNIVLAKATCYKLPSNGSNPLKSRPVIVGSGPAGLFCALMLSKAGFSPIVLERGKDVDERSRDVELLFEKGILNTRSNVSFGEGGAGTFSDGKLNTMVKDKFGRNRFVLEEFVKHGAKKEILYDNKPHLGTDVLKDVVKGIRQEIISLGGEFYFSNTLLDFKEKNGQITTAVIEMNNGQIEELDCQVLVLALGHSARDTFEMLKNRGLNMEKKAFAVGVRIEHPAIMINESMYGKKNAKILPTASYKLTYNSNGRGVYSFCMCPGGYVVNASTEEGRICVNGMSYSKRDGENSNSALVVTVKEDDFKGNDVLAGMYFQRELEEKAFTEGNGKIPLQTLKDFKNNEKTTVLGEVKPSVKGGYSFANLRNVLPEFICQLLCEGISDFDKHIKGYGREDALLSAVESRTSSPVRILRDGDFESNIKGIYPCGEGAGYAGGITSAAMDGIKTAEAIIKKYYPV
ncbi:hypothetical protein SAMN05216249_101156 [Acetitomaculum ruminis DSM 5522]|uniref:Uncharacterized protein n=1 Tax=Acetitomaculum ruminis DSM 5522 TaxID=1120918 RepID=A0A1I0V6M9_9FIRM|nr:FAD-dependent monooxygenase [Acetitomaculum ruminis]SFA71196.1 hypothetical protein SAMN05216249_101156 [Acetitomaculum ruminis DSM 5522]